MGVSRPIPTLASNILLEINDLGGSKKVQNRPSPLAVFIMVSEENGVEFQ
jgi:hypothetical protein